MITEKRVLILYITERSGHHSAAMAIQKALLLKNPHSIARCVNAFRYAFPFTERIIHFLYLAVIKRVPKIWEKMYDNPSLVKKSAGIKNWIHRQGVKKVSHLIETFKPDAVVCTQAFPCGLVADYKKTYHSSIPLIAVLTDFVPHAFWLYDAVDQYIVAAEDSKDMLVDRGIDKGKIKIFGIPIDPKFATHFDKNELLANFGLKAQVPIVMLMGGGRGLGPIKDVIFELDVAERELQLIVICGLNKKLYRWLNDTRFKNRILKFKFTDQVDRLMTCASVLITKPGGITTAEALAKKLPMVILDPIPGQEKRNTEILMKNAAAFQAENAKEVWPLIKKILDSPKTPLRSLSFLNSEFRLSRPKSSLDIAELIQNL